MEKYNVRHACLFLSKYFLLNFGYLIPRDEDVEAMNDFGFLLINTMSCQVYVGLVNTKQVRI